MCGIVGYLADGPLGNDVDAILASANQGMKHRGPDSGGLWFSKDRQVGMAHRRLSVIDLAETAGQPMRDSISGDVIVFNGEIYNYQELRAELKRFGYCFKTNSDTEVILLGYRHWGRSVLERLNGMFAFAVWNNSNRTLFLARDRFGVKPLYYSHFRGKFIYASTLKAILKVAKNIGMSIDADISSLGELVQYGWISGQCSAVENVNKLAPASWMEIDSNGEMEKGVYWDPDKESLNRFSGSYRDYIYELSELLADSVRLRMISDVPVGVFLSGGIDSSLTACLMADQKSRPISSFTIGFDTASYDESHHAGEVAKWLGLEHHKIVFSEQEVQVELERMIEHFDEPAVDLAMLPTALISRNARSRVTVALTGDGGDEMFYGYPLHFAMHKYSSLRYLPSPAKKLIDHFLVKSKHDRLRRLSGFMRCDNRAEQYLYLRSQLPDYDFSKSRKPLCEMVEDEKSWQRLPSAEVASRWDRKYYLPDALLIKTDLASMRWSLEAREPLLDYRVAELAFRAPVSWRLQKKPLKDILNTHLPRRLWERPKQGFSVPIASWLRGKLGYLLDELAEPSGILDCILDRQERLALIEAHRREECDYSNALWSLLIINRWHNSLY